MYGLQNDIRTHSPTHTPAPEAKQPTEEELQEQVRPTGGSRGFVIFVNDSASIGLGILLQPSYFCFQLIALSTFWI